MKISEIIITPQADAAAPTFEEINNTCSEYLHSVHKAGKWLYRGSKRNEPWYMGSSRDNRVVRDSSPQATKIFDHMLSQLGHKALRSNSVFSTSLIHKAQAYGRYGGGLGGAYVIFPKNGCDYTWTNQQDLILRVPDLPLDAKKSQAWLSEVQAWVRSQPNPELKWTLGSTAEIVLHMLQDEDDDLTKALPAQLQPDIAHMVSLQTMKEKYAPHTQKTDDLAKAIYSGVEVMIKGSYYAFNVAQFGDMISLKWSVPIAKN